MLPSLRQLRFLVALADERHVGRAAEACHVSQSTLSAGLKELEATLGVGVAERTKRSVTMTPVGEQLAERARGVLTATHDLVDLASRQAGTLRGDLRLGTIPTIGPYLIPHAMPALRRDHPDLRLYLREELTESLIEGLAAGRLDAILIALPYETGDLATATLFEDSYTLAAPRAHPLAGREQVSGADLREHSLLLLERGHCLHRHALSAFPEVLPREDDSFAATSLSTLLAMVEMGLGLTLLPQLAHDAGAARSHEIALVPLRGACPRRVVLAWRRTSPRQPEFEALAEVFRAARARLAADADRPADAGDAGEDAHACVPAAAR
ncbi:LysR family transcriptional regulator, hydrogen peroxide-inducible genes activator [Limimonas halophila]|uniref:LysR family transcriptional regulator, hydrogen peroxide-inducible genes activator n=1 Tax=Limimonas halophila TaxID=1082479 RepID=A0A1G7R9P8_9PROT|nr:hydrogen peroxide-inducible genes activator [Limimonas halophila]SDG07492.1 LysR family transcriptional regulator, hydrogen peroxide-inducible genes activator [Limimonas halophila]